ncbi:NAD-dependent epimerase/dehydratase family protein [Serratia marcescens]|uniref:NAD-dependent epimerase/dehydratase family protein n=1 Tax=Serratia marcescens TaxID=615 RepID=UPI001EFF03E1|nr:NAD-dependent epimerase/dehydratase family protein [Serratia marcescens]
MRKNLLTLLFFLFCSNVIAGQDVLTAFPKTGEFKFVWSSTNAVYKSQDGKVTVRCNFDDSFKGVDDDAEPYIATTFICQNGINLILKQVKSNNNAWMLLTDKKGKLLNEIQVLIDKQTY